MPCISVVLPTYNRADTIRRAIDSVLAQSFEDWELIIVDDGSKDGTKDVVTGIDPRVRVFVQENQGVAGARNAGLAQAQGDLIAFLDSDDEMPPYHLGLAAAFFAEFPGEHVYTSEFWESFGPGGYVRHFRIDASKWYPDTARVFGSKAFPEPPPEGDPYLWYYEERQPAGSWASSFLSDTSYRGVSHYSGYIFPKWQWGWLMALQPTVVTREAMEATGAMDTRYRIASDFGYLAKLCRHFRTNLIDVPGCIKHEYAREKHLPAEGHLVTGASAVQFHLDVLHQIEELFGDAPGSQHFPDLAALRGFRQYLVGRTALLKGQRELALDYLGRAAKTYPGKDAAALLLLAQVVRNSTLAASTYRALMAAEAMPSRLWRHTKRLIGIGA